MSLAVSIDPIFWLLCAIGFVVLEAMTWNLVSIWFAVGSAAALLSCLLVQSFRVQAAVFKKLRNAPIATNGDRNLGREATVLTPVTAEATGRVRLDGVDWNARCVTPGDTLAPGESCRVMEIHSTLLIVEPIRTETTH